MTRLRLFLARLLLPKGWYTCKIVSANTLTLPAGTPTGLVAPPGYRYVYSPPCDDNCRCRERKDGHGA